MNEDLKAEFRKAEELGDMEVIVSFKVVDDGYGELLRRDGLTRRNHALISCVSKINEALRKAGLLKEG